MDNDNYFYAFLARFFDAEGSLCIYLMGNILTIVLRYLIPTENYSKRLDLSSTNSAIIAIYTLKGGAPYLCLSRKAEIIKLLKRLPLKHEEKIEKRELLFAIKNTKYWHKAKDKILALRAKIREEILECIKEAKKRILTTT